MLKAEKTPGVSRTARSCQVLRQTMIRLLKEKELEKITVTELCLHAQINRSTFYEYYDDIHDLMNDIETNFLEKADQLCAYITAHVLPPETVTSLILEFISDEKETLSLFISSYRYTSFLKRIHKKVTYLFRSKLMQNFTFPETVSHEKLEHTIQFLSSGFYSVYLDWIQNDCREDPKELASQTVALSQACLNALLC